MTEIILHVFDGLTSEELSESEAFTPNTKTFSFNTDTVLTNKDFGDTDITKTMRINKTRGQDFKDRVVELKARALTEKECSKDYCHWCKDCFNKVCNALNMKQHKIP